MHSSILAWEITWTGGLAGYRPWRRKEPDTTEHTQAAALYNSGCFVAAHVRTHGPGSLVIAPLCKHVDGH